VHKFDIKHIEKLDNPQRRKDIPPRETLEKFGLGDEGIFLDIGCGIGYFTIPAAEMLKRGKAIGIDIMEEMLRHAEERAGNIKNIEFRQSKEYSFPAEDKSMDYIMLSNVLHEIEDKVKYLVEIKRVLKESGRLYLIEWDKDSRETGYGPPADHRLSKEEIKELCTIAGLSVEKEVPISKNHFGMVIKI
jgi:ubiquinone/menaquinone biosynthesis C-methylase UbiE